MWRHDIFSIAVPYLLFIQIFIEITVKMTYYII